MHQQATPLFLVIQVGEVREAARVVAASRRATAPVSAAVFLAGGCGVDGVAASADSDEALLRRAEVVENAPVTGIARAGKTVFLEQEIQIVAFELINGVTRTGIRRPLGSLGSRLVLGGEGLLLGGGLLMICD